MICPYCNAESDTVGPHPETDPHGRHMCDDCSEILEIQWRLCVSCDEYGMAQRGSGVWICSDCGLSVSQEESITEHRIASSADYLEQLD